MSVTTLIARMNVLAKYPEAYAYTPAPHTWQINLREGDDSLITLGQGRSEASAWKNAEDRLPSQSAASREQQPEEK